MFLNQSLSNIFEVFHRFLEEIMFSFKSHAPNVYEWSNSSNTAWVVDHMVMFWNEIVLWEDGFKKFVMFKN